MDPKMALEFAVRYPAAHLVLCRADNKAPARPWLNYRPKPTEARDHVAGGGLLGVVPWTVGYGYCVLDVDSGVPAALALEHTPAFVCPTQAPGHAHLWYMASEPLPNSKWAWEGLYGANKHRLSGEVRCANGYVVLWHDAALQLAHGATAPDCCDVMDVLPSLAQTRQAPPRRREPTQTPLFA